MGSNRPSKGQSFLKMTPNKISEAVHPKTCFVNGCLIKCFTFY